eukprot:GHVH01012079.1.p1 GENE.GHVH01012079.1~~GHVH01012079.1.p1  ORF type:complete len:338 (+),score=25.24 GHVH01012079.1:803-1816(+)
MSTNSLELSEHVVRECLACSTPDGELIALMGGIPSFIDQYPHEEFFGVLQEVTRVASCNRVIIDARKVNSEEGLRSVIKYVGQIILRYFGMQFHPLSATITRLSPGTDSSILKILAFLIQAKKESSHEWSDNTLSEYCALKEIMNGYTPLSIEVYSLTNVPLVPLYHSSLRINNSVESHFWSELGITILPCFDQLESTWLSERLMGTCSPTVKRRVSITHINHYRSIPLGIIKKSSLQCVVTSLALGQLEYIPENYCMLEKNCNTFVRELVARLGIPASLVPSWIDQAANIASNTMIQSDLINNVRNWIHFLQTDPNGEHEHTKTSRKIKHKSHKQR